MKLPLSLLAAVILALSILLVMPGCNSNRPQDVAAKETAEIVKLLPPEHKNLKSLGNQWFEYELQVGGQSRKFMVRYWTGSHGEVGLTVTELK